MKRDLGNFTRGSQLIGQFGFMFAAGLKKPADYLADRQVLDDLVDLSDHDIYLAWMHVRGASTRCIEAQSAALAISPSF